MNRDTYTPEQWFLSLLLQSVDSDEVQLEPVLQGVSNTTVTLPGTPLALDSTFIPGLVPGLDQQSNPESNSQPNPRSTSQEDTVLGLETDLGSVLERDLMFGELTADELSSISDLESPYVWDTISRSSGQEPLKLGAKSVVQGRFYALLKQRLKADAESNLPLFPWETEVCDYDDEVVTSWTAASIATWSPQFRQIRLPVDLPAAIMAQLFQRCQDLVQSSRQEGRRLVDAIESLFPEQGFALNDLANTVRLGYSRDGEGLASRLLGLQLPDSYSQASAQQQMTLAMIAAYELFSTLTLKLSVHEPQLQRGWETIAGPLQLQAQYSKEANSLQLQALLPTAGSLTVRTDDTTTLAHRDHDGPVSLLLSQVQLGQRYELEVELEDVEIPLKFSVQL